MAGTSERTSFTQCVRSDPPPPFPAGRQRAEQRRPAGRALDRLERLFVRGEPIVCTPEDSYRCFMRTEMDYLVLGPFLLKKKDQPNWQDLENWRKVFKLD